MNKRITVFIPYAGNDYTQATVADFLKSDVTGKVYLLSTQDAPAIQGADELKVNSLFASDTFVKISEVVDTDYILLIKQDTLIRLGQFGLERLLSVAKNTDAGLVYADYHEIKNDVMSNHPLIEYQKGSLRDDFDFGPLLLFDAAAFKAAQTLTKENYSFAGLYDLRLKIAEKYPIVHMNEFLYSSIETDARKSGEKIFDYVDPKNRNVQIEMEDAVTKHLKRIGGYLPPVFDPIDILVTGFPVEASVVIPVRNRIKTINDAVTSVLKQKTSFPFNLIIVDNFSTDGTTEKLAEIAKTSKQLIHVIPDRKDLGIGGCWNEAVHHPMAGKFVIQLDSDDLYKDENTVQKVVDKFYEEKCAMVIGSYQMTNFNLEPIPPGIIDHREWTPENGRNNALRINGLGAPRAFYTPLLREIKLPNTSYGEDYAVALAISRKYQIGRIYDTLYLCRRWDDNTDASLNIVQMNNHNFYKDKIRTIELEARIRMMKK